MENIESWTIEDLIDKTNISYSNKTRMKISSLTKDELCLGKEYKDFEYNGKDEKIQTNNLYEALEHKNREKCHLTSKLFNLIMKEQNY